MRTLSPRIAPREVRAAAAEMFGNGIGHVRVARTLGLSPNTVRDWLREYRAGKFRVDVSTNQHHFSAEAREAVIAMREAGMSLDPEFADLFYAYGVLDSGRFIGESCYLVWLGSNQASFYLRA